MLVTFNNKLEFVYTCGTTQQAKFTVSGICHGFVLWIDWVLDAENSVVIPTGPGTFHKVCIGLVLCFVTTVNCRNLNTNPTCLRVHDL